MEQLFQTACNAIDAEAESLSKLSQTIWTNPELCFEEKIAHETLTDYLEHRGFKIERHYKNIGTAFRAVWSCDGGKEDEVQHPHVAILCEYDALPEIGHACGHNLIAQAGVAGGLGIKAAMEKHGKPIGKVTVLGTPAEEGGGGKVDLIEVGAFEGVDAALMVHPTPFNLADPVFLAVKFLKATYHGRASHASALPWEGVNALDAAVQAYNSISAMRQQIKPTSRIHGIITKGGIKPNIIPDLCQLEYYIRAQTMEDLHSLTSKLEGCLKGAATATGCTVDIEWERKFYMDVRHNTPLTQVYIKHMNTLEPGRSWTTNELSDLQGSSDMGNVSHVVPSIHPFFYIGDNIINHHRDFTAAAGSKEAQPLTQNQGKALAMTGIELLSNPSLLDRAKAEFKAPQKK